MPILSESVQFVALLVVGVFKWFLGLIGLHGVGFRLYRGTQNYFQGWETFERGVNEDFSDAVSDFTEPFGGPLQVISNSLADVETTLNDGADILMAMATALDGVIKALREADDIKVLGVDLDIIPEGLSLLLWVIDRALLDPIGLGGHAFITPFAFTAGVFASAFGFFAGLSPIEAASGLIGAFILLIATTVVGVGTVMSLASLFLQLILRPILSVLPGPVERKTPKPYIPRAAMNQLVGRVATLVILLSTSVPLLLYTVQNELGVLTLGGFGVVLVIYGEFENRAKTYAYGVILSVVGVIGFWFELGIGLLGVGVLSIATLVLLIWGMDSLEIWSQDMVTEAPAGGK